MGGADTATAVAVEVVGEEQVVAEVWVARQLGMSAEDRADALAVGKEEARQSARQLGGDFVERAHAAGADGALHLEVVAVIVVELLQRLDQQVVHREPDRTAPV